MHSQGALLFRDAALLIHHMVLHYMPSIEESLIMLQHPISMLQIMLKPNLCREKRHSTHLLEEEDCLFKIQEINTVAAK